MARRLGRKEKTTREMERVEFGEEPKKDVMKTAILNLWDARPRIPFFSLLNTLNERDRLLLQFHSKSIASLRQATPIATLSHFLW